MSYRLDVVTTSVADAVRHAGGLMFDRGRAGWRVVVVTDDSPITDAHVTALAILGTCTQSPGQLDDVPVGPDRSVRIRVQPLEELRSSRDDAAVENSAVEPCSQLLFWGAHVTGEATGLLHAVRHDLSSAARTFKDHALRCAGLDTDAERSERFWASNSLADVFKDLLPDEQRSHDDGPGNRARSPSPDLVGGSPHG